MATVIPQIPDKIEEVKTEAAISKAAAQSANSVPALRTQVAAQADQITKLAEVAERLMAEIARLEGR